MKSTDFREYKDKLANSRRVKDDNSAEVEAENLMDFYWDVVGDLEDERSSAYDIMSEPSAEEWEDGYINIIDHIKQVGINNPQEVYDYLENENYHRLNWCLLIAGVFGKKGIDKAKDFFMSDDFKKYYAHDYGYLGLRYVIEDYLE